MKKEGQQAYKPAIKEKAIVTVEEATAEINKQISDAPPEEVKLKDIEPGKQDWSLINKLQDLVDKPLPAFSDLETQDYEEYFKCLLREKIWFVMGKVALEEYNMEYIADGIGNATYIDVSFHVRRLDGSAGCGAIPTDRQGKNWIGFASGKKMTGGILHADAKQHICKYNRNLRRFEVDGKHVTGAEAIILAKGCQALVINPVFAA